MELDLTRLNSLAFNGNNAGKETAEKPPEPRNDSGEYKNITGNKKPLETLTEGLQGIPLLQRQADNNKAEKERALSVYREYQQNIQTSAQLQADILKGVRAGEGIYSLFLKAVQAISLMTSNQNFYNQLESDIQTIYGKGLQEPIVLTIEDIAKRYVKLMEAAEREPDGDSKQLIYAAAKVNEKTVVDNITA